MYEVCVRARFSAAHQIREYGGNCERLHGHNWLVEVAVRSDGLDELGMVIDFRDLKRALKEVLKKLDHRLLNEVEPFDRINPTSENIAEYIFERLCELLPEHEVAWVRVWESEDSSATYSAYARRQAAGAGTRRNSKEQKERKA